MTGETLNATTRQADVHGRAAPSLGGRVRPVVVTGGSGFIGSNLAASFLDEGRDVVIVDNLSRPGVERNLEDLSDRYGRRVHTALCDVRDLDALMPVIAEAGAVFHLAAQTAVTTSLADPLEDFEVNGRGTINVLEAVRRAGRKAPVVFASTNKVYGSLADLATVPIQGRHLPDDPSVRERGIGEDRPLDFCTPYGCSKGVADQYVLDYARSFAIPAAVLRMSCIYGPRQLGTEDQGWVAHFLLCALSGRPVTIYGDGRQVRDVLYVDDAVAAYRMLHARISDIHGRAFNLGGGPRNAVSILELLREVEAVTGQPVETEFHDWRPGDQLYFVADTGALARELGWQARVTWRAGLHRLAEWFLAHPPVERPHAAKRRTA